MRRSARESRKPEFLTFPASGRKEDGEEHDGKNKDPSTDHEDSDENEVQSEEDVVYETKPKASTKGRGKGTKQIAKEKFIDEQDEGLSLFERINNNRKFDNEVNEWIEIYKNGHVTGLTELVNLALMASGFSKKYIEADMDLEALDGEEIDQLLDKPIKTLTQTAGSKSYPLAEKGKSKHGQFRKKYQEFWETLSSKLLSVTTLITTKKKTSNEHQGFEAVRRIVELLTNFSSLGLVNIRDSITDAILSMNQSLISAAHTVKEQRNMAKRQLEAIEKQQSNRSRSNGMTSSAMKQNPKYQAYTQQLTSLQSTLTQYHALINTIFNSIYIHRSKDSHDEIRLQTVTYLPTFLFFDIVKPIKGEYLKYLGWLCNDYSANVRYVAIDIIQQLLERLEENSQPGGKQDGDEVEEDNDDMMENNDEKESKQTQFQEMKAIVMPFFDHFLNRFIEIANGDNDFDNALLMIQVLRKMQKLGLLDTVADEKLDQIDQILFDPKSNFPCRLEAFYFLLDHTEGFEDIPIEAKGRGKRAVEKTASSKHSNGKAGASDAKSVIQQNQIHAFQLETLIEFVEQHLQLPSSSGQDDNADDEEEDNEATNSTPNEEILAWSSIVCEIALYSGSKHASEVFYDYNIMIMLLLKEEESLFASGLTNTRCKILIHWLLSSVKALYQEKKRLETAASSTTTTASAVAANTSSMNTSLNTTANTSTMVGKSGATATSTMSTTSLLGQHPLLPLTSTLVHDRYTTLMTVLYNKLPTLLVHYQDNQEMIRLLSELFPMMDLSLMNTTSQMNQKKGFVKQLLELYKQPSCHKLVLRNIIKLVAPWSHPSSSSSSSSSSLMEKSNTKTGRGSTKNTSSGGGNEQIHAMISEAMEQMIRVSYDQAHSMVNQLQKNVKSVSSAVNAASSQGEDSQTSVTTASSSASKKGRGGKKGSSSSSSQSLTEEEVEDLLHSLVHWLFKFQLLWEYMDISTYLAQDVENYIDELLEIPDIFLGVFETMYLEASSTAPTASTAKAVMVKKVHAMGELLLQSSESIIHIISQIILWKYKKIIDTGKQLPALPASSSTSTAAASQQLLLQGAKKKRGSTSKKVTASKGKRSKKKSGDEESEDEEENEDEEEEKDEAVEEEMEVEDEEEVDGDKKTNKQKKDSSSSSSLMDLVDTHGELSVDAIQHYYPKKLLHSIQDQIATLLAIREQLVGTAMTMMQLKPPSIHSTTTITQKHHLNDVHQVVLTTNTRKVYDSLQCIGFRCISRLRVFFPVRESQYLLVDTLAYQPSSEVLHQLRVVFDEQGSRLQSRLQSLTTGQGVDEDETAGTAAGTAAQKKKVEAEEIHTLSLRMIEQLLYPLSQSFLFDMENMNRRQAAAVLQYLVEDMPTAITDGAGGTSGTTGGGGGTSGGKTSSSTSSTTHPIADAARYVAKRLKDTNGVKFLEVVFAACKMMYQEEILPHTEKKLALCRKKDRLLLQEEDEDENENEEEQDEEAEEERNGDKQKQKVTPSKKKHPLSHSGRHDLPTLDTDILTCEEYELRGYAKVQYLAKKLSTLLGIPKFKDTALRSLLNFHTVVLEYAFSASLSTLGFVEILHPFIRLLPLEASREVATTLLGYMNGQEIIRGMYEEYQEGGMLLHTSSELHRLVLCYQHLQTGTMPSSTSTSTSGTGGISGGIGGTVGAVGVGSGGGAGKKASPMSKKRKSGGGSSGTTATGAATVTVRVSPVKRGRRKSNPVIDKEEEAEEEEEEDGRWMAEEEEEAALHSPGMTGGKGKGATSKKAVTNKKTPETAVGATKGRKKVAMDIVTEENEEENNEEEEEEDEEGMEEKKSTKKQQKGGAKKASSLKASSTAATTTTVVVPVVAPVGVRRSSRSEAIKPISYNDKAQDEEEDEDEVDEVEDIVEEEDRVVTKNTSSSNKKRSSSSSSASSIRFATGLDIEDIKAAEEEEEEVMKDSKRKTKSPLSITTANKRSRTTTTTTTTTKNAFLQKINEEDAANEAFILSLQKTHQKHQKTPQNPPVTFSSSSSSSSTAYATSPITTTTYPPPPIPTARKSYGNPHTNRLSSMSATSNSSMLDMSPYPQSSPFHLDHSPIAGRDSQLTTTATNMATTSAARMSTAATPGGELEELDAIPSRRRFLR